MIQKPKRSVTRFFIPLIDVLLLLFVIFLLMPVANLDDVNKSIEMTQNKAEEIEALEREIQKLREQLQKLESLPRLDELRQLQQLRDELERTKAAQKKNLQERTVVQVIDIDGKTGDIYFYDPARDVPRTPLDSEAAVKTLIDRHMKENPGRELYYLFLYPRPETAFPNLAQERTYQRWFRSVAHSLKEAGP